MKLHSRSRAALAATLLAALPAVADEPATALDAIAQGKAALNVRLRYEHVDQDNALKNAEALTVRTRLGYQTAAWNGLSAFAELQNNTALVNDYAPESPGYSTVADPEGSELSQASLAYKYEKTTVAVGRQRLVLDNARFIGDVGWRQLHQTFDSVTLKDTSFKDLSLTYAYIWRVKRVFADIAAQPHWESDSHVAHAAYSGLPFGKLAGYAYLLDFDNSAANSTATFGASFAGSQKIDDTFSVLYKAELATQSEYGSSTLNYDATYYNLELGLKVAQSTLTIGYEVLGSDNGVGFKTPLATSHAFNGWADVFVATPPAGLEDLYLKVASNVKGVNLAASYHWFQANASGADFGTELNLLASYKINKYLTVLAKAAFYEADSFSVDTNKFWLQTEFAF